MWITPFATVPVIPVGFNFATCTLTSDSMLSEDAAPVGPFIRRPVGYWFSSPGVGNSDTASFENIAAHPDFPRIAVAYDTIPEAVGAVWGNFPASTFNAMAPRGALRNQKGREAAVARRERGCEPYSYVALSYDERGRVEALVRYTENIDFDAVYYTYNSMNQVTSVRTADYLRQHQTWYGFDANGRVDSVWTALGAVTSGLYDVSGIRYRDPLTRPDSADIVYRYTRTGQVDTMLYPPAGTMVTYDYNHRKWLDSLVAVGPGGSLFREILSHDPTGQIMRQVWQHGTGARTAQAYSYDSTQRLKAWTEGPDGSVPTITSAYTYDAAGNRLTANVGTTAETYTVTAGMNRLASRTAIIPMTGQRRTDLTYNANGAATVRELTKKVGANSWVLLQRDEFGYSFRDLLKRTVRTIPISGGGAYIEDWRYRYSAGGEREQKRKMPRVIGHEGEVTPWVYYLLGADKAQLAVYHAQEGKNIYCTDTNNRAWWYPWEYITNGVGGVAQVLTRPTGAKQYVVSDHLGSARTTVDGSGAVLGATDFRPFGEPIVAGLASRKSYIDREVDRENNLGNFGVRAYDAGLGRFLSVDPLWEKYRGLGGYQYAGNDPVGKFDKSGDSVVLVGRSMREIHRLMDIVGVTVGGCLKFDKSGLKIEDGQYKLTITGIDPIDSRYSRQQGRLGLLIKDPSPLAVKFVDDATSGGYYDPQKNIVGISRKYCEDPSPGIGFYEHSTGELVSGPAGWLFGMTVKTYLQWEDWDTMVHELIGHAFDEIIGNAPPDRYIKELRANDETNYVRDLRNKPSQTKIKYSY